MWWKRIAWTTAALVVVTLVGVLLLITQFDATRLKAEAATVVMQKTQRQLDIAGEVDLHLFPNLSVRLGRITLSEPASNERFAAMDGARISVRLWPLLTGRLVADKIELDGFSATLQRSSDGGTNFADLLSLGDQAERASLDGKGEHVQGSGVEAIQGQSTEAGKNSSSSESRKGKAEVKFDIAGIAVRNGELRWIDELYKQDYRISGLYFSAGQLGNAATGDLSLVAKVDSVSSKMKLALQSEVRYDYDLEKSRYAFNEIQAQVRGEIADLSALDLTLLARSIVSQPEQKAITIGGADLKAKGKLRDDALSVQLEAPRLQIDNAQASGESIVALFNLSGAAREIESKMQLSEAKGSAKKYAFQRMDINWRLQQGDLKSSGWLHGPLNGNLHEEQLSLPTIKGEVTVAHPNIPMKSLKLPLNGHTEVDYGQQTASGTLNTKVDDSSAQLVWSLSSFSPLSTVFDLLVDRLNVDKYYPPAKSRQQELPENKEQALSMPEIFASSWAASDEKETPIDLSILNSLNAVGKIRFGSLQAQRIKLSDLRTNLHLKDGKLNLQPLSAHLYQGKLAGTVSAQATGNRIKLKQTLSGVNINPLMQDVLDKDLIEGRGNVRLALNTSGATVGVMKRRLNGTVGLNIRDGAIKGINLAKSLRGFKAALSGDPHKRIAANKVEKTDFTELEASFKINNGIAHNDDLSAKSPFIRLSGEGDIDIGKGAMDYLATATLVASPGGQDDNTLGQLKGVPVPVKVSGPFDELSYRIDFKRALEGVSKAKLDKARTKAKERLLEKLGKKKGQVLQRVESEINKQGGTSGKAIGEALKGLFK